MRVPLTIVVPSLFARTETFITRHIQELSPGNTAIITLSDDDQSLQCPILRAKLPDRSNLPWLIRKPLALGSLLLHGYSFGPSSDESARIASWLKHHNVRTVLAEFGYVGCMVASPCREANAKLYVHYHGIDASAILKKWHMRYAYRRLSDNVAGLICPSQFLADNLVDIGMPSNKMHIVPYGIDIDHFTPGDKTNSNLILAVGRFVPKKAPNHTIDAFAKIAEEFPAATLEMIGDGKLLASCKEQVRAAGLRDRVIFHGAKPHHFVLNKMQEAALFVQHSVTAENGDTEGLPVAILEAMATGLPVIATKHAGIPEAVISGETGLLIEEHDVDGMAGAISALYQDEARRRAMGKAGRKRAIEHFSLSKEISQLREIIGIGIVSGAKC